ncbi:hypothetical protein ACFX11_020152 [Malus domestica]
MGERQHLPLLLRDAVDDKGWSYQIDEGGGAFYGPKIDLKIEDALGRRWQCSTIQLIFHYGFRQYKLMFYQLLTLSDSTPLSTPSRSRTPPPIPQSSTAPP